MNFLKRAALSYLAKTIQKSLPHATDEELQLQWERVELNIRDATDPEVKIRYITIQDSIVAEITKRRLV